MLRKLAVCLFCLIFLLPGQAVAAEPPGVEQIIEQQLGALDTAEFEAYLQALAAEYGDYLPQLSIRGILSAMREGDGISLSTLIKAVLALATREIAGHSGLLARLVVLSLICVLLQHLHNAVDGKVADIAYLVCYLVVMGFAIQSFGLALRLTRDTVTTMTGLVQSLYPILLTTLMAVGNVTSAALFNPLLLAVLSLIMTMIANLAVPLIFFAGILILADHLSEKIKVSRLAYLLRDVGAGVMGVLFMAFVGFNIAYATTGPVFDGVAFRAGKFAVKTFIPVVGGVLADGFETIAGCSQLINSAVGLLGAIGVTLICLAPAIKLVGMLLTYRVAAAVIQPLGDGQLSSALNGISGIFTYFPGALLLVGVMLFVVVTVLVSAGNSALMLR
jgi:stage III sporulation protein AE